MLYSAYPKSSTSPSAIDTARYFGWNLMTRGLRHALGMTRSCWPSKGLGPRFGQRAFLIDDCKRAFSPGHRSPKDVRADCIAARRARSQPVRDHMRLECEGDWDGVIATFAHPRYELYGAGTVFEGEAAVRGYFAASRIPFPDQANEIIAIAAEGDTVLVEFWLTGTHLGPLRTPKS